MLKETLEHFQRVEAHPDFQENSTTALGLFYQFIFFLENQQDFPNQEINDLASFNHNLILDGHITIVFYEQSKLPEHLALCVDADGMVETPKLFIPQTFVKAVAEAPETQIGSLVATMSHCRDYFCNLLTKHNGDSFKNRAHAYEAEALQTLLKMAKKEQVPLHFTPFQEDLLERFPNGLADLAKEDRKRAPEYKAIYTPPKHYPSRN